MAVINATSINVENRLKNVDAELHSGELVGLIGPNGAGKTTLLHVLSGIQPFSGRIEIDGVDLRSIPDQDRARRIALQPQFIDSAWTLCVADIVSFGRIPWGEMDQSIIHEAMHRAGVADLASRRIDQLSGGEKARVWLARMLAHQADILLLDEPVANLDIHYQHEVLALLSDYVNQGHSVMIAIHDLSLAARYCDRVYLLEKARLVATGSIRQVMTTERLSVVFGIGVHVDLDTKPPVVLAK